MCLLRVLFSFALIIHLLNVSLCAAVAGFVCARSHLEAAFCAKKIQWSAACEAAVAVTATPVPS